MKTQDEMREELAEEWCERDGIFGCMCQSYAKRGYVAGHAAATKEAGERVKELEREVRDLKELEDIEIALAKSKTQEYLHCRASLTKAKAALEIAALAIPALASTQKDEGLGLLGKIMAPDSMEKIRAALRELEPNETKGEG